MKTKLEIIEETATSFNLNKRAMNENNSCCYCTKDGRKCAIGRLIQDKLNKFGSFHNGFGETNLKGTLFKTNDTTDRVFLDDIIKPEYIGHSFLFWASIQELHDNEKNWSSRGLSKIGLKRKRHLIKQWKED